MAQITIKSDGHSVYDFRYNHGGEYPAAWVRWKQDGAESSKAFDHDRTVLVVTALEGSKNQIVDFLGLTAPDLENWAEYADCELRREHHLPERGQEWDTNALRDPAPLSVEFAEGLRCF